MENTIAIISPFVAMVSGVALWLLNEHGKRKHHIYMEKVRVYSSLIDAVKGFYASQLDLNLKHQFINSLHQSWMYASADVIDKSYEFLDLMKVGSISSDEVKETALNEIIYAIRKDMKLKLPKNTFKTWSPT